MCPKCKRIYPNSAPDLFHPMSVDELKWQCPKCGASNDDSYAGAPAVTVQNAEQNVRVIQKIGMESNRFAAKQTAKQTLRNQFEQRHGW